MIAHLNKKGIFYRNTLGEEEAKERAEMTGRRKKGRRRRRKARGEGGG